jgi:hypothetical protein
MKYIPVSVTNIDGPKWFWITWLNSELEARKRMEVTDSKHWQTEPSVKSYYELSVKITTWKSRVADPDLHLSQNSKALEAQNRAVKARGRLQWRPGGLKWSLEGL